MKGRQIEIFRNRGRDFHRVACWFIMMALVATMLIPAPLASADRATGEIETAEVAAVSGAAVDWQGALQDSELTLLFFHADWCSHCQQQEPVVAELENEYSQSITFVGIDGPSNPQLMEEYAVEAYPTMILVSGTDAEGVQELARVTGFTSKEELQSLLDNPYTSVPDQEETCAPLSSTPDTGKPSHSSEDGMLFQNNSLAAQNGPLITILAPSNSSALNAPFLTVQALVEASASLVSISKVQFSVDGKTVETLRPRDCGQQLLADIRIKLGSIADGLHQLTVTAFQDRPRMGLLTSVSVNFTVDRTLPETPLNRVEEIATPAPFMCLSATGNATQYLIQGDIVLGTLSDGLDPAHEHFVIVLGTDVVSIPAGSFTCKGRSCQYLAASGSIVREVALTRQGKAGWKYSLELEQMPPAGSNMYLRLGNDWGAIDLDTGKLVTGFEAELDHGRSGHMAIGPAGGTVETTDADGVVISLVVPPDALTTATDITVTPLLTSAIPGYSGVLHQGVRLEPEGLSFAQPAILTLNFSASGQTVEAQHFIFLLTSPLTALPLSSQPNGDTISAPINHFSTYEAGSGSSSFTELAAWGDPILESRDLPTLSEMQSLLALAALQQAEGECGEGDEGCLDLEYVSDWSVKCIEALMGEACQQGLLDPSDEWLQKLLDLWAMYESFGTGDLSALTCIDEILEALIEEDGAAALASPTDANLQDLADRKVLAAQLGLDDLEALADAKIKAALFEIVQIAIELCPTDEEAGKDELDRAEDWAELIGSPSDLATAIQNARDNCSAEEVQVIIKAEYWLGDFQYNGSHGNAWALTGSGLIEDPWQLEGDTAPPLGLILGADRAYMYAEAASPGDGIVFTVDASAYASFVQPNYPSGAFAFFRAWLYIPGPGTLNVTLNPEWGMDSGTAEAQWRVSLGEITESAYSGERHIGSVECTYDGGCYDYFYGPVQIPATGIYVVSVWAECNAPWYTAGDWGSAYGSGRLLTIGWVPGAQ